MKRENFSAELAVKVLIHMISYFYRGIEIDLYTCMHVFIFLMYIERA